MSQIVRIKNNTIIDKKWAGQSVLAGTYYDIPESEISAWKDDDMVFTAIANGDVIVNKGSDITDDILDITEAWKWMLGDTLPISSLGKQLSVHSSTKPEVNGKEFFLQWTGAGDDVTNGIIGEGELLSFSLTPTDASISKEIRFDPQFGDTYIHEGYAKWYHDLNVSNGAGDYMSAMIVSDPTQLQTVASLDCVIVNDWVKYAPGGAGTGTHGFAATPILVPRGFSKDGDWDYDGTNLTPNLLGTGGYNISSVERIVHRYINKIPMCFTSNSFNRLTSDETAYLPPGYFIRVTAFNVSASNWNCAFMFEVYRERTAVP